MTPSSSVHGTLAPLAPPAEAKVRRQILASAAQLIADQRCGCRDRNCPALRQAGPDAAVFADDLLGALDEDGVVLAHEAFRRHS